MKMQTTSENARRWRERAGTARLTLWKLSTVPYNAVVYVTTFSLLLQSRAWKIRAA
jgi:hypothetical protein